MSEKKTIVELRTSGQSEQSEESEATENLLRNINLSNNERINEESESANNEPKKVNSFITVLSIWNTMLGSSTVALPFYAYYSGIIPTIGLSLIYGLICLYTCKIYVDFGFNEPDFSITIEKYFSKKFGSKIGKIGKNIQILFCALIAFGALLIYFLIMSQNLYPIACLILNKTGFNLDASNLEPAFGKFSLIYLSIILCFALFFLIIKKDLGFLIRLSSFGIYFISLLILFVIYSGISSLINTKFHFGYIKNKEGSNERYLKWFGEKPSLFAGTLSLGFFSHTSILPVLKRNKNQANNIRDLSLGYFFAGLTFSLSGIFGYIGFSGKKFGIDFKDNWFMFFSYDDYFILFLRLLNVFQLISVFPILAYVVRFQLFNFFYGDEYPSKKHVVIYAVTTLILCLLVVYFLYNVLGKFISFIGATTSFILIYTFPPVVKMINYYLGLENKNIKGQKLEDNTIKENNEEKKEDKKEEINEEKKEKNSTYSEAEENKEKEKNDETEENQKKDDIFQNVAEIKNEGKNSCIRLEFKDYLYFLGQSLIILVGIATVVFTIIPINFFNIKLKD